jgi:hypothetical protein
VAVYAAVNEQRVGVEFSGSVVYTQLDDAGLRRLRKRLGTTRTVTRGADESGQRIRREPIFIDKPTGRVAVHVSVTVELLKPGRASGQFHYGDGENGAVGSFHCRKSSGTWVADIKLDAVS